ncbi:hypothetical protein BKA61DRAFT_71586 [Leptodontidium sp. MPI-SDFR-AT-0119]|nr:hypothetical protein BKA61DRAFT_71586 [Leptodontidium sp. MPI-SDFR-AT-0119]
MPVLVSRHPGQLQTFSSANLTSVDIASIIRQKNSWSRLQISHRGFLRILSDHKASAAFVDFVRAFGFKASHSDENFGGYSRQLHGREGQESIHLELCYNIRYPEQVGRDSEYSWVLRHMAVYHNYSPETSSSKWIVLQPSRPIESKLESILQGAGGLDCTAMVNLMILTSTEANWRAYIKHLESEINSFNEKACCSRVGKTAPHDYSVAFSDSQELQVSRERLLKARSVIESSIESSIGIEAHLNDLGEFSEDPNKKSSQLELQNLRSRMRSHIRALERLLEVSSGTSNLLLKVMDFRNDESVRRSAANTQAILHATRQESEHMSAIAQRTQVDSRSMKIMTSVAIAYLPANLFAGIFSSSIVQNSDGKNTSSARHIGYYILATLVLTLATFSVTMTWERDLFIHILSRLRRIRRL